MTVMVNVKIFQFNPLQENTYVLYDDAKNAIIIDPGCYFDAEKDQLASFIEKNRLKPRLLLNTHCHLDHVFGNKFIHETYGLELHLHHLEERVLELSPSIGLMWNLPFDNYSGKFHFIQPGSILEWGGPVLQIIETPGHSPGSISFYQSEEELLIAGDVLFRESVGRTDLPGGDPNQLLRTISQTLYSLPNSTRVYSGHGIPTTIGHEKLYNPFVKG
jgi:hydroxyacylglutathione hydrolase